MDISNSTINSSDWHLWNTSLTNETSIPAWITYKNGLTAWYFLMLFFAVLGSAFNFFLIAAILSSKKLRSGCGVLIVHMLGINFVLCSIIMPMLAYTTFHGDTYQYVSQEFCRYQVSFYLLFNWAVIWASLMISINRFVAIFFPHNYSKWTSKTVMIWMILMIWIPPVVCALNLFFGIGAKLVVNKTWGACGTVPVPGFVFLIITFFPMAVPVAIQVAIYMVIFVVVRTRSLFQRPQIRPQAVPCPDHQAADALTSRKVTLFQRRYRSAKMLFISTVLYSVALIPAPIAALLYPVQHNSQPLLQLFFRMLTLLANAAIPVSHSWVRGRYRDRLNWILKSDCPF